MRSISLFKKTVLAFWGLLFGGFFHDGLVADVLHLKSGGVVDIGWDYTLTRDKVIVKRDEGSIGIPLSDVLRIEKRERGSKPESKPKKAEAPEPQPPPPQSQVEQTGDSSRLVSLIEEVLEYVVKVNRSPELSEEDREEGLGSIDTWIQETRDILRAPGESTTREIAEDLLTDLETLHRELGDGNLSSGLELERSLRTMLEKL